MGKLLILSKYIFLIYGIDINESRKHIHVTYAQKGYKVSCKFWLEPEISLDKNNKGDFSEQELNEIRKLIIENKDIILKQLESFLEGKTVTAIRK